MKGQTLTDQPSIDLLSNQMLSAEGSKHKKPAVTTAAWILEFRPAGNKMNGSFEFGYD